MIIDKVIAIISDEGDRAFAVVDVDTSAVLNDRNQMVLYIVEMGIIVIINKTIQSLYNCCIRLYCCLLKYLTNTKYH